jgi:hypothetical protein
VDEKEDENRWEAAIDELKKERDQEFRSEVRGFYLDDELCSNSLMLQSPDRPSSPSLSSWSSGSSAPPSSVASRDGRGGSLSTFAS